MSAKKKVGQELEIIKKVVIEASPEVVFKTITDPNELTNWYLDHAMFDGKIGGKVKFYWFKERSKELDRDYDTEGTVKEFIPNKKVSYGLQLKDIPDFPENTVTWELEKIDVNKTRVVLTHLGFTGKEEGKLSFTEHDKSWSYFLGRLKEYCEKTK